MDASASSTGPEPGAPLAPGQLDPELVNLKQARRPVGAIAAACLVVLAVFLAVQLIPDLRFARRADAPRIIDVQDADAAGIRTSDDEFVELRRRVSYGRALRVRSTTGSLGMRLTPVLGTGGKVWVAQPGSGYGEPTDGVYRGRARGLDDIAFGAALRARAAGTPVPMYVRTAAWRTAAPGAPLPSLDGEQVRPRGADVVELDEVVADQARIIATFTERLPDVAAWTAALTSAGLALDPAPPSSTGRSATFIARLPGGQAAVAAKLDAAQLWGAIAEPITETRRSTVDELRANPAALGPGAVDRDGLLRVWTPMPVPADAVVIIMGEAPGDYWYVLPVAIGLAIIALLFAWATVRALRRDWLRPSA